MSDYRLSADPAPKAEMTRADGAAELQPAPAKPATPIRNATAPSLASQLAAANETIGILRDLLNTTAAALSKLTETIAVDTGQAAVRGAVRADEMRRFQ